MCRDCGALCSGDCRELVRCAKVRDNYYYAGTKDEPRLRIDEQCDGCGGLIILSDDNNSLYVCDGYPHDMYDAMEDDLEEDVPPCGARYSVVLQEARKVLF